MIFIGGPMIRTFYKEKILQNKNNKIAYYCRCFFNELIPSSFLRNGLDLSQLENIYNRDFSIRKRVDYYNKLTSDIGITNFNLSIGEYKIPDKIRVYYFDSKYYLKHFNSDYKFNLLPGDITIIPENPTIVKSRPIGLFNQNSVLLNLDKCRHFNFLIDRISFRDRKSVV